MKDGYPTEEELEKIRVWDYMDMPTLFEYIESLWTYDDPYFRKERLKDGYVYHISTAGWSGNEDIISALSCNLMVWSLTWQSSRRGGHYEFIVKDSLE